MEIVVPKAKEDHTIRVFGEDQGFRGLPVRMGNEIVCLDDRQYVGFALVTAWKPDPDELARLNAGEAIYVSINATTVSPMLLSVEPAEEFDVLAELAKQGGG